ncbi:MAG: hypothetical protein ACOH5I_05520 [Oligoflexus sp.]
MTELPQRVRVVVLGAGLHGLGVLHDMLSRGWHDIVLLDVSEMQGEREDFQLESLFSLFNLRDFRHIPKAIEELSYLQEISGEYFHRLLNRLHLDDRSVFDKYFHQALVKSFRWLTRKAELGKVRSIDTSGPPSANFMDALVSASCLRDRLFNHASMQQVQKVFGVKNLQLSAVEDGWELRFLRQGREVKLSSLYVVNALGTACNRFLAENRLPLFWSSVNLERKVEVYQDLSAEPLTSAWILPRFSNNLLLQLIPIGNRQLLLTADQQRWGLKSEKESAEPNGRLLKAFHTVGILHDEHELQLMKQETSYFAVLYETQRQVASLKNVSPFITAEHRSGRGLMISLYNMKTMTFRALGEEIGDRIVSHFGENRRSQTRQASWFRADG